MAGVEVGTMHPMFGIQEPTARCKGDRATSEQLELEDQTRLEFRMAIIPLSCLPSPGSNSDSGYDRHPSGCHTLTLHA
jgi:hypothetical protein